MDERRLELQIGSAVFATDGNCGHIQQLVIDPYQEKIVGLAVKPDLLSKHLVMVPIEQVENAAEGEVWLKLDCHQVQSLPAYTEDAPLPLGDQLYLVEKDESVTRSSVGVEILRASSSEKPGMVENQIAQAGRIHPALNLHAGQQVFCSGQHVGCFQLLLLAPSGKINNFVMRTIGRHHHDFIVPVDWVQEVDQENVRLSVEKEALERLDEYVTDLELADKIDAAIWGEKAIKNALWVTYSSEFDAAVHDGMVTLRGHVPASTDRLQVENAVKSIPGVLGIVNRLVADYDLTIAVAQALSHDERTHLAMISVDTRKGIVSLSGHVESASNQLAAEEIAASVPYVRGVVNDIQAPGVSIDPAEDRFLQPPIGGDVYATDNLLGTVEKVIINPHNRRVMAILVHGNFPDPNSLDPSGLPHEETFQRRRVILPSRLIRYEKSAAVFLDVDGIDAAGYEDYDAAQYEAPDADWQPPYPYRREDILFIKA